MRKTTGGGLPIFVDLDGSLIHSDLLIESVLAFLKRYPFRIFLIPLWLLKGKAHLKAMLAKEVDLRVELLPYNEALLEYLEQQHSAGRDIILATASNEKYAAQVVAYHRVFSGYLASDGTRNLSGDAKCDAIKEHTAGGAFAYVGNDKKDIPIWRQAQEVLLVGATGLLKDLNKYDIVPDEVFSVPTKHSLYLRALRPHQWAKNALIFLPAFAAHDSSAHTWTLSLAAFLAFSLCASSVYLLNDLFDLDADRLHPRKKSRPFAAGSIDLRYGLAMIPLLLGLGFVVAANLSANFVYVLLIYYMATLSYSLGLKRFALVDVMLLSGLYTIRVIGGAAATDIPLSYWIMAFSMFIFVSLALVKRCAELKAMQSMERDTAIGRGYIVSDLEYLHSMGVASGYLSVLVLALYIHSEDIRNLYHTPDIMFGVIPMLMYWISRMWLKAGRGEMDDDPLVFSVKDRQSQIVMVCMASVMVLATIL